MLMSRHGYIHVSSASAQRWSSTPSRHCPHLRPPIHGLTESTSTLSDRFHLPMATPTYSRASIASPARHHCRNRGPHFCKWSAVYYLYRPWTSIGVPVVDTTNATLGMQASTHDLLPSDRKRNHRKVPSATQGIPQSPYTHSPLD